MRTKRYHTLPLLDMKNPGRRIGAVLLGCLAVLLPALCVPGDGGGRNLAGGHRIHPVTLCALFLSLAVLIVGLRLIKRPEP